MTPEEAEALYEPVRLGQKTVAQIARETGRDRSALYRLFNRRFGYKAGHAVGYAWPATYTPSSDVADLAYIAGIIDGEGSIMFTKAGRWAVAVGMTDEPVIAWLASFGTGRYSTHTPRSTSTSQRKTCYTWRLARKTDVRTLLVAIEPYMRVKRERALECIAAMDALD